MEEMSNTTTAEEEEYFLRLQQEDKDHAKWLEQNPLFEDDPDPQKY